jgi:protease I
MSNLNNKNILVIATNGFQEDELFEPLSYFNDKGSDVKLASPSKDAISAGEGDDRRIEPDMTFADVKVSEYDALILPGGLQNPDTLRQDDDAIRLIQEFATEGKTIGAICHAPWLLAEADILNGREVTSFPSIKTDLTNAGASWVDKDVVCDNAIVTSRKPGDLPAFCAKIEEEILEGQHDRNLLAA